LICISDKCTYTYQYGDLLEEHSCGCKAALRKQLKEAIDSGNTELAKTLMSLLQKLEGDR
jgi:hypothetical protein